VRGLACGASLLWLASAGLALSSPVSGGALGWFASWITLEADDVRDLREGRVVAKMQPAADSEIAVFIAGAIDVDPDTFVDAVRHPERLWQTGRVPRVGRFSSPPRLEDLEALHLSARDVDAIRSCRPGDCDVKLTATEIRRLQVAASVQDEFRRLVLDRVTRYLESGLGSTGDIHDHEEPVDPLTVATGLLLRSPWLTEGAPRVAEYIEDFPRTNLPGADSFLYWRETTYTPKPTIQVVHVSIDRRATTSTISPEVLVVSRQVFASHYLNGSLSLSALIGDCAASRRYLAYVTRAHVDDVDGWLSGLRRLLVERRVRQRGAAAFDEQRRRIESWTRESTRRQRNGVGLADKSVLTTRVPRR
jgi:hypothetical protein